MSQQATAYAGRLARMGKLKHSSSRERPGQGENLAMSCGYGGLSGQRATEMWWVFWCYWTFFTLYILHVQERKVLHLQARSIGVHFFIAHVIYVARSRHSIHRKSVVKIKVLSRYFIPSSRLSLWKCSDWVDFKGGGGGGGGVGGGNLIRPWQFSLIVCLSGLDYTTKQKCSKTPKGLWKSVDHVLLECPTDNFAERIEVSFS